MKIFIRKSNDGVTFCWICQSRYSVANSPANVPVRLKNRPTIPI